MEYIDTAAPAPASHRFKTRRKRLFLLIIFILAVLGASTYFLYIRQAASPFSKSIKQSVSFPIYYPTSLPQSYTFDKGSAKVSGNLLYYSLQSGGDKISITEQAAPTNPPNLKVLPNFKNVQTLAGSAVIGASQGAPVGFLISNTTLVSLSASKDVPNDVLGKVIQAMSSLPQ